MAQQMVNGSRYQGNVTETNRMSKDYAVVSPPFKGKHRTPQDPDSIKRRKQRWQLRGEGMSVEEVNRKIGKRK